MKSAPPDEMLSVDEARALVLARTEPLPSERVRITDAHGRVLAEELHATRAIPAFDNSAMDGVGVRSVDVATVPVSLRVVATSLPGAPLDRSGTATDKLSDRGLAAGECVRIMTGAPVPAGVDAIVMREMTDESALAPDGTGTIVVKDSAPVGQHVRKRGEDVASGAIVGRAGARITSARINLWLASGLVDALVVKRPRACVIASGDELREVGEHAGPRDVVNSNAHALAAALRAHGCDVTVLGIMRDSLESHVALLEQARAFDVALTIGGVSMGTHDFVRPALEKLGATLEAWRVAMRPGKPIAFAKLGTTRVFGLPGNPVSAQVSFALFVAPALARMRGLASTGPRTVRARLAEDVTKKAGLEHYFRGAFVPDGDGVRVLAKQGSHQISALADADCLVRIPSDWELVRAGEMVECIVVDE